MSSHLLSAPTAQICSGKLAISDCRNLHCSPLDVSVNRWLDGTFFLDFLSSSNSTPKATYVCYLCFSSGTKKSGRTYTQVRMYTQAWACLQSYEQLFIFKLECVFEGWGDKKATSAKGVVHTEASSVLSHLPASPLGIRYSSAFLSSPTELPPCPLPQACLTRKSSHSSKAWDEHLHWPRRSEAEGDISGPLHDHFSTLYFGLERHWVSLSQMPSSVWGLLKDPLVYCLSLLNTDDEMVGETRGLVMLVPDDRRCRRSVCHFSTCMWPKLLHRQHLGIREQLLQFFLKEW